MLIRKNGNVCYNDEFHRYWDEGNEDSKYVSVTTLIHGFSQPFDKEFWSAYKALQKLLPTEKLGDRKKGIFLILTYLIKNYSMLMILLKTILTESSRPFSMNGTRQTEKHAKEVLKYMPI